MGARTELILTLLGAGLLYHRFVKRIQPLVAVATGTTILGIFLLLGFLRGGSSSSLGSTYFAETIIDNRKILFSIGTEFQTLFAGAYDLTKMIQEGDIKHIPLQLHFYDLLMVVPQQFLPFDKIDVQQWYLAESSTPGYFMFNPIAQAAIGFGWAEIILRGVLLAAVFAWFHNIYLRHGSNFWVSVFYVWMMLQAYYSIRSSSFYFMPLILYRFIPLVLFVTMLRKSLVVINRPHTDLVT
jgi:hypothetical protein